MSSKRSSCFVSVCLAFDLNDQAKHVTTDLEVLLEGIYEVQGLAAFTGIGGVGLAMFLQPVAWVSSNEPSNQPTNEPKPTIPGEAARDSTRSTPRNGTGTARQRHEHLVKLLAQHLFAASSEQGGEA
eukprot:s356_g7.t4